MKSQMSRTLVVAGLGNMGALVARTAKAKRLFTRVIGIDPDPQARRHAIEQEWVDLAWPAPNAQCARAEMIVVAAPPQAIPRTLDFFAPWHQPGTLITEMGSVKSRYQEEIGRLPRNLQAWIAGSHPLLGSERPGPLASREAGFDQSPCLLVPFQRTAPAILPLLEIFWRQLGCRDILTVPLKQHDQWLAQINHLSYLVAGSLIQAADSSFSKSPKLWNLAGPGFRDATRIAAGESALWGHLLQDNRVEIRRALARLIHELQRASALLEPRKSHALKTWMARGRRKREALA